MIAGTGGRGCRWVHPPEAVGTRSKMRVAQPRAPRHQRRHHAPILLMRMPLSCCTAQSPCGGSAPPVCRQRGRWRGPPAATKLSPRVAPPCPQMLMATLHVASRCDGRLGGSLQPATEQHAHGSTQRCPDTLITKLNRTWAVPRSLSVGVHEAAANVTWTRCSRIAGPYIWRERARCSYTYLCYKMGGPCAAAAFVLPRFHRSHLGPS